MIKPEITGMRKENNELIIEFTVPIQATIERTIVTLDPEDFGCKTPEEKEKFFNDLKEVASMVGAMNDWFGDNSDEEQEEEFSKGWDYFMKGPDAPKEEMGDHDWQAGYKAARENKGAKK